MKQNMSRIRVLAIITVVLVSVASLRAAQPYENDRMNDDIRRALLRLPYYGVFDYLTFSTTRAR